MAAGFCCAHGAGNSEYINTEVVENAWFPEPRENAPVGTSQFPWKPFNYPIMIEVCESDRQCSACLGSKWCIAESPYATNSRDRTSVASCHPVVFLFLPYEVCFCFLVIIVPPRTLFVLSLTKSEYNQETSRKHTEEKTQS